ncbi:MAG TPA: gluconokinase, partial [bacterium]|nr:gluconokinase [bacterium]
LILMGVSGSGKTTLGRKLAEAIGCPFFDGDDLHPPANREKMAQGTALNDADRAPWLAELARAIGEWNRDRPLTVLACSALKASYREKLGAGGGVRWIHLKGDRALIAHRLKGRSGHFFPPALLDSQFHDLEEPEDAWTADITQEPDTIVAAILRYLRETRVLR